LNEALNNAAYRNNTRRLQRAIAEANGLSAAVDIIEQALGISRNSLRSSTKDCGNRNKKTAGSSAPV